MPEPQKVKTKLIDAKYVKEAKSVLLLLECDNGRFKAQIHRDTIATFGNRTEAEIEEEMIKYVDILNQNYHGKHINSIFDTELENKIKDNYKLKY